MPEHVCIDCKASDPTSTNKPPRRIATDSGQAPRCATHQREVTTRRRKQSRARTVERTYGISDQDNHALFLLQGGRCWLCRKATGATKSLAVDHDHSTGEVRGRLCGPCNQFIGKLGDDPEAARRLVAYLTGDTPYRRLKAQQTIEAVYGSPCPVHSLITIGGELYANVEGIPADPATAYRVLVRRFDGTWSASRD